MYLLHHHDSTDFSGFFLFGCGGFFVWFVVVFCGLFVCFASCMHVEWVNVKTGELSVAVHCMVSPVTKDKSKQGRA